MIQKSKHIRKTKEHGFVSIIVALVVMIVLTLIVLGFAQLARREQRAALDRQLSTQAFYAAESGINVARREIEKGTFSGSKTDCISSPATVLDNIILDASTGARVTCLLVDSSLEDLFKGGVGEEGWVTKVKASAGTINDITIEWQNPADTTGDLNCVYPTLEQKTPTGWNCSAGLLRVDIVPTSGTLTRSGLLEGNEVMFLYPSTSGSNSYTGTNAWTHEKQGQIVETICSGVPANCSMTIDVPDVGEYHVRVRSIYQTSDITICANACSATLTGAQYLIDSTGQAVDVLRRIQVRIPIPEVELNIQPPIGGLTTTESICKLMTVLAGDVNFDPDPACQNN